MNKEINDELILLQQLLKIKDNEIKLSLKEVILQQLQQINNDILYNKIYIKYGNEEYKSIWRSVVYENQIVHKNFKFNVGDELYDEFDTYKVIGIFEFDNGKFVNLSENLTASRMYDNCWEIRDQYGNWIYKGFFNNTVKPSYWLESSGRVTKWFFTVDEIDNGNYAKR